MYLGMCISYAFSYQILYLSCYKLQGVNAILAVLLDVADFSCMGRYLEIINVDHLTTSFTIVLRAMLSSAHTSMNFLLVVLREHINKQ